LLSLLLVLDLESTEAEGDRKIGSAVAMLLRMADFCKLRILQITIPNATVVAPVCQNDKVQGTSHSSKSVLHHQKEVKMSVTGYNFLYQGLVTRVKEERPFIRTKV
jgi:hypothetical protein